MTALARKVQAELRKLGLNFQPVEGYGTREDLLLKGRGKQVKQWIQLMDYELSHGTTYSLSWAMPFKQAQTLIHHCKRVEFDEEALLPKQHRDVGLRTSRSWEKRNATHPGHLSVPCNILCHLVLTEVPSEFMNEAHGDDKIVRWVVHQMSKNWVSAHMKELQTKT
jgi:hypothetical protein